ncbi:hypothetical protein [Anaerosolibacter sp.]|uniref:hypothetical protein n=1 Tax=Anaerosolibacter sp. TaxID=1872527 RepID=UPI0039F0C345
MHKKLEETLEIIKRHNSYELFTAYTEYYRENDNKLNQLLNKIDQLKKEFIKGNYDCKKIQNMIDSYEGLCIELCDKEFRRGIDKSVEIK